MLGEREVRRGPRTSVSPQKPKRPSTVVERDDVELTCHRHGSETGRAELGEVHSPRPRRRFAVARHGDAPAEKWSEGTHIVVERGATSGFRQRIEPAFAQAQLGEEPGGRNVSAVELQRAAQRR
jgi:hypothetical protein